MNRIFFYNEPESYRLSKALGAAEHRTEAYIKYVEGAAEATTPRFAKSASKLFGFAGRLVGTAGDSGC